MTTETLSMIDAVAQVWLTVTGLAHIHLLACKKRIGWVVALAGQPAWFVTEIIHHQWLIIALSIVYTRIQYRGWVLWGEPESPPTLLSSTDHD